MTSISKNMSIKKLNDIVKMNNAYHRTIKIKDIDVNSSAYTDLGIRKVLI